MSITTESPRQAGPRVVGPVARSNRRRPTPTRRRYVHSAHRAPGVAPHQDACAPVRASNQSISWTATVAGVVGTAVVLLALIGMANMRAGQLESAPQPAVATVQQGETLSEFAARVAPGEPVQQVVDGVLASNGLRSAAVTAGQQLVVPAKTGE